MKTICQFDSQCEFQDFSVTQILREINFGESRSSTVFAILSTPNFVNLAKFRLQKVQKFRKIQNPEIKMANSVILDSQLSFHVKSE